MSPGVRAAPDEPTFSPAVALGAWLAAFLVSNLGAVILLDVAGYANTDSDTWPIWLVAILQVPLWLGLIGAVIVVSRRGARAASGGTTACASHRSTSSASRSAS